MSVLKEMLAAGPGCAIANGLMNAFETTKVKLQLHQSREKPVYHTPTTRGVMQQIIAEEGLVRGLLTPGLSASLMRSMIYGSYRVGLYSTVRDWMHNHKYNNNNIQKTHFQLMLVRILSGMGTGGLGALLTCPLDVVRTRMQADAGRIQNGIYTTGLRQGLPVRYHNLWHTLIVLAQQEGGWWNAWYRGATVTIARASLLNGAQLASYDTLKRTLRWQEGPTFHLVCAMCSGVIAQTVVMPIDTIKSSFMMGRDRRHVWKVIQTYGPLWFYRGYVPACAGQSLVMAFQMTLIEEFRRLLGIHAL